MQLSPGRRLRLLAVLLLLVAGVLAGCGDDDSSSGDGGAGGGSGEIDTAAAPDDRTDEEIAADKAAAQQIVLGVTDVPEGFVYDPSAASTDPDEADSSLDDQMFECIDLERTSVFDNHAAGAESGEMTSQNAAASSRANVYPDEAYAEAVFAPFAAPDFTTCFRDFALDSFRNDLSAENQGVEFGDVVMGELEFPELGDDTAAFRLTLTASLQGQEFQSYIDFVEIRVGRIRVSMSYRNVQTPFDAELAEQLARTVVGRAEQAG